MLQFDFFNVPRILFGRGTITRLPELAAPLGNNALLVYSGPDGAMQTFAAQLATKNIRTTPFRQKGEPTTTHVDHALDSARNNNCNLLIALGGGSAIDCAKATAGLLTNGGAALDYMEVVGKGQKITKPAAPWIAIPTTAGTGAEATRNAVIGYPEKHFKASIRSELLLPRIALIDPELAVNVPPHVIAASGMDALCQCIEAYTSSGATKLSSYYAIEGVHLAAHYIKKAFEDPTDLDAREGMALAALYSGIALTNAGLGAVHGFAAPLGASFPIHHGVICSALLPHVLKANIETSESINHPVLDRYLLIGANFPLSFVDKNPLNSVVPFTEMLVRDLKIPRLATFGLTTADIPAQVALAQKSSSMRYNPIQLPTETLEQILTAAL
jgi:alcohol dehydrogenase class IV